MGLQPTYKWGIGRKKKNTKILTFEPSILWDIQLPNTFEVGDMTK